MLPRSPFATERGLLGLRGIIGWHIYSNGVVNIVITGRRGNKTSFRGGSQEPCGRQD